MASNWIGMDTAVKSITETAARGDVAAKRVVSRGAAAVEAAAKKNFEGSHAKGEPHVGGNKPNVVTGNLRRSIITTPTQRLAFGYYSASVGPTAVYGRRVELGYASGAVISRAFPYFEPGIEQGRQKFTSIAIDAWMTVRG